MSVRLKLEDSREGMLATISERNDSGKVVGHPSVCLVASKDEAKQKAKALARSLGLKVYGIVDKTGLEQASPPWQVPGVGNGV